MVAGIPFVRRSRKGGVPARTSGTKRTDRCHVAAYQGRDTGRRSSAKAVDRGVAGIRARSARPAKRSWPWRPGSARRAERAGPTPMPCIGTVGGLPPELPALTCDRGSKGERQVVLELQGRAAERSTPRRLHASRRPTRSHDPARAGEGVAVQHLERGVILEVRLAQRDPGSAACEE